MAETNASASPKSFKDDFSLFVLKTAIDELRSIQLNGHQQQISAIKQSIYLLMTIATAVCAVVTCTPFWNGLDAPLSNAGNGCVLMFGLAFAICGVGFCYGVYALFGEKGGILCHDSEPYTELMQSATDDDQSRYKCAVWACHLEASIQIASENVSKKGKKVRILNGIVLAAGFVFAVAICMSFLFTFFASSVQL